MDSLKIIQTYLEQIVDELHPLFTPISDEHCIGVNERGKEFARKFLHKNGKKFEMCWLIVGDTPETVKLEFYPAVQLHEND